MNFKLSPTALGLMKDCPRCFWLEQHGVWKRPPSIFPSLPSGMDRVLKQHFDNFMVKGILPPELRESKELEGVKLFDDVKQLELWRESRIGLWYEDGKGNVLHGGVDNILVKDEKLIVLDYKTRGTDVRSDSHSYYVDQMAIYTFLLRKLGYKTQDYAILLFYFPDRVLESGEVVFNTRIVKVDLIVDEAEKLFVKAINFLNGPCPEKHQYGDCAWCEMIGENR